MSRLDGLLPFAAPSPILLHGRRPVFWVLASKTRVRELLRVFLSLLEPSPTKNYIQGYFCGWTDVARQLYCNLDAYHVPCHRCLPNNLTFILHIHVELVICTYENMISTTSFNHYRAHIDIIVTQLPSYQAQAISLSTVVNRYFGHKEG